MVTAARRPVDLPEGYHTTARGPSCTRYGDRCVEDCPRAAARSGDARSTGCRTSPGVWAEDRPGQRHAINLPGPGECLTE